MTTAVASWGNSEAIRIPQDILRRSGLRRGDRVDFSINERGNIEIIPEKNAHRCVEPAKNVTYETLFNGYAPVEDSGMPAWPNDDMRGAEFEAWSR